MTITVRPGDPPLSCQHYRIDNDTGCCRECDEPMIVQHVDAETVLSAPNAAGCGNPACLQALEEGTYDETDPPTGCTNPHGFYYPDRSRQKTVVVGWNYTYECARCTNNGMLITAAGVIHDCGKTHRGDRVPVGAKDD